MQVNFKGLYLLTGQSANTKIGGKALDETRNLTLKGFLKDTKPYRDDYGYSYYNRKNGDYYLAVRDTDEADFEDVVDDYGFDCYKVGDKVSMNEEAVLKEFEKLQEMRFGTLLTKKIGFFNQENLNNNFLNKNNRYKPSTVSSESVLQDA